MNKINIFGIVPVLVIASFVFGVHIGEKNIPEFEKITSLENMDGDVLTANVNTSLEKVDFSPYWKVWNILENKFIPYGTSTSKEVLTEDKIYDSIDGLVSSYNDPYTVFMRPKVSKNFKIKTKGSLEGIGAIVGEKDGEIVIVMPLPNSPAEKSGLAAGDKILLVDNVDIKGKNVDDVVNLIRGKKGTDVKLTIKTSDTKKNVDVVVTRGTIEIPSTAHKVVKRDVVVNVQKDNVGTDVSEKENTSQEQKVEKKTEEKDFYLLRLFSFSQTSINSFKRELIEFINGGSDFLIIDLRGNPGGYIESAVRIASWFLPEDSIVVREYSGPDKKVHLYKSYKKNLFDDKKPKIAILVDKGTASAAEILAGALQEYDVAIIVGTNTFGKGCVQELVDITDNLSLKVTVARWYTPNGVSISEGGLTPDIFVDVKNATSGDPWLDAAVEALSE